MDIALQFFFATVTQRGKGGGKKGAKSRGPLPSDEGRAADPPIFR